MDQNIQPPAQTADELTENELISKDILELMGAQNMPDEQKRNLYTKMLETIQNRVINRIINDLPEQDRGQWQQIAEAGDQAKMNEFLTSRTIDLGKLMLQETMLYKAEMVELTKPLQQASQNK